MPLTLSELLSLSNREFLRESYRTYLSRDIDESGEAYYLRRLSLGYNKIDILYDLRRSDEFCATPADLATLNEYFRRNGNTGAWGIRSLRRASYILRRLSSLQDQLATAVEANATFNIIPSETKPTTQDTFAESKSSATPSEITQNSNTRDLSHPATAASHFPPIAGQPLISVIIVNYNGSLHLPELGESLKKQTYKNFEVVFVDNNSSDDSIAIATRCLPNIKIVASKQNTGFAEGNNLGLEKSTGDLLFLLNNDTRIAPDCLAQLLSVFTGKTHKQVGAVVPKIQFFKPFSTIEIEAPFPFTLDPESLLQQCPLYKKIIPQSPLAEPRTTQVFLLPAPLPSLHIILSIDNPPTYRDTGNPSISVSVDGRRIEKFGISFENDCIELHLPEVVTGGTAVINNVGSYVHPNGDCGDIGIYELDRGQYDNEREVDALCGCAALIRRDALGNFPLFASDFFAYYEDTELSIRLRSGGWKIIYTPLALVNHKHAATSDDKSANFRYLVARNRLLFLAIHFKHLLAEKLTESMRTWNHFVSVNSPEIFPEPAQQEFVRRLPSLMAELPGMLSRIYYGTFFLRRNAFPRIGIFNEYWGTLGGGELRALRLAEVLSQYFIVDLICNKPFDLTELQSYFGLNLTNVRKTVILGFSAHDTRPYDLFINSTHHSNLVSHARNSWYLLSFPHAHVTAEALSSYDLVLANSEFSSTWVRRYWGSVVPTSTLYPPVDIPVEKGAPSVRSSSSPQREAIILSVGRFFVHGHCKRQLEMVSAFRKLTDDNTRKHWRLILVGSLNQDDDECVGYFNEVAEAARGANIELRPNAPRAEVLALLQSAAIYWQATGLGVPVENPENMEHFGMALAEALMSGCVPVVHRSGGMPEVLGEAMSKYTFDDLDELIEITSRLTTIYDNDRNALQRLSEQCIERAAAFGLNSHANRVEALLRAHLGAGQGLTIPASLPSAL